VAQLDVWSWLYGPPTKNFAPHHCSRDFEKCLTVRHFTLCGKLLERLFSCNSESITAAHVRDHSTVMICSVQKRNWRCCNVGCHIFRNRQRIILMMLMYITRVTKLLLASRILLFELLHAALWAFRKLVHLFFISIAKCWNVVKWYCGS